MKGLFNVGDIVRVRKYDEEPEYWNTEMFMKFPGMVARVTDNDAGGRGNGNKELPYHIKTIIKNNPSSNWYFAHDDLIAIEKNCIFFN